MPIQQIRKLFQENIKSVSGEYYPVKTVSTVGRNCEFSKTLKVAHVCNLNTWETKAGGSQVEDRHWLHSEFETSVTYVIRLCLKKTKSSLGKCLLEITWKKFLFVTVMESLAHLGLN
jgi:hypothetical protein